MTDDNNENSEEGKTPDTPDTPGTEPETESEKTPEPPPRPLGRRIARLLARIGVLGGCGLVFMAGMAVLFYPRISNYVNTKNASRVVRTYQEALLELSDEDYALHMNAARAYNARLAGGETLLDSLSFGAQDTERTSDYWDVLNIAGNGIMGVIKIASLEVELPIYHGTSAAVLTRGAGHLMGTSIPVGGENTHAAVTAHTGLPSARLFTGVDRLRIGDTFTLYILNEVLTYQVDRVMTVLPHEVEGLSIEEGGDYVTLVTCTPYGINSHRLLVRGARIETPPESIGMAGGDGINERENEEPNWLQRAMDGIVVFFAGIVEGAAEFIVRATEWVMDLFGVEYA